MNYQTRIYSHFELLIQNILPFLIGSDSSVNLSYNWCLTYLEMQAIYHNSMVYFTVNEVDRLYIWMGQKAARAVVNQKMVYNYPKDEIAEFV